MKDILITVAWVIAGLLIGPAIFVGLAMYIGWLLKFAGLFP